MNDQPDADDIPQATAAPRRRWSLPLVWIIPLVAALIGGWVAVKAVLEQGPTITITFKTAEGLEAGQTKLKYKDVNIGVVREIHLGPDLKSVVVTAELDKSARDLLAEDTRFWVVRARIAGGQVSGLGTLLSGSYISVDPGKAKKRSERFVGLENQPIVTSDLPGKQYILRAEELGSLDIGAPVFFRRIQVGSVVAYELDPDGQGVELKIFVHAPYDKYVNANTRFWNASGVDVALNTEGLSVRTEGLSALVIGGIAFQTPLHAALDGRAGGRQPHERRRRLRAPSSCMPSATLRCRSRSLKSWICCWSSKILCAVSRRERRWNSWASRSAKSLRSDCNTTLNT